MAHNHGYKDFLKGNREGIANFALLSLLLAITIEVLTLYDCPSGATKDYFFLPLFMGFATAVWIGWYTPTRRIIGLIIVGGLIGLGTEYSAQQAGLWTYGEQCHFVPVYAGALIHAITAVTIFGLVHIFERMAFTCSFSRTTGWFNGLLGVALVFTLFAATPGDYHSKMVDRWPVMGYYILLFALAITFGYCMRVGRLLSIILAGILVGLIGEYAGGTRAEIWCWLGIKDPTFSFPPAFLVFGLWPIEGIVEYSLSALLADVYVDFTRVKRVVNHMVSAGHLNSREDAGIRLFGKDDSDPNLMGRLLRITRRTLLRTLVNTPEKGQLMVVFLGMLTCSLVVMERWIFGGQGADFTLVKWDMAAVFSAMFLLAVMVGSKPHWSRALAFGLFSLVLGYVVQGALLVAFNGFRPKPIYFGSLFWGPFWATIFFVIYGAAYLFTRFLFTLSGNRDQRDKEEPNVFIAITVTVLTMIFAAIAVIRPDFLIATPKVSESIWGNNHAFSWFLLLVLAVFCFWWFFLRISWRRSLGQFFCAAAIIAGTLFAIDEFWLPFVSDASLVPGKHGVPHISVVQSGLQWLFSVLSLSLVYVFSYTASAHVSGECLEKAFHATTYSRRPMVRNKDILNVCFHGEPHLSGIHREIGEDKNLHTYPPKQSSVNVTFARDSGKTRHPAERPQEGSLKTTLDQALSGFIWPYGKKTFDSAVREKTVFIKPNVVVPFGSPYTTDPKLVELVIRRCIDAKAKKIYVGEMAISNITSRLALEVTGLKEFWQNVDRKKVEVLLLDQEPFRWISLDGPGVMMKSFHMPERLLEPDTFYINMPKMKTHLQSSVTLGIKNSHGLVPECDRGDYHAMISQKVVDITKAWVPDLTIIDGYDALEGIGPWPGDLVPFRGLIISNDVVLADLVASQLMGKEPIPADFSTPIDFTTKTVKSTWLGFEQGLGIIEPEDIIRTKHSKPIPVRSDAEWEEFLNGHRRDFKRPEYEDEGLIRNIGARFGECPRFDAPIEVSTPDGKKIECEPAQEFLLEPVQPTGNWGPIRLVSDDWEKPDLGSSVMFSGVFGLMKTVMESHLRGALDFSKGYAIVYGALRKPLVCEGAILFGKEAIATEYFVFAPRIYKVAGQGSSPPNYYSDVFERLAHDLGGDLMAFCTEAVTFSRGWYW